MCLQCRIPRINYTRVLKRLGKGCLSLIVSMILIYCILLMMPGSAKYFYQNDLSKNFFDFLQIALFQNPMYKDILAAFASTGLVTIIALLFLCLLLLLGFFAEYMGNELFRLSISCIAMLCSVLFLAPIIILSIIATRFWGRLGFSDLSGLEIIFNYIISCFLLSVGDGNGSEIIKVMRLKVKEGYQEKYIVAARARNANLYLHFIRFLTPWLVEMFFSRILYFLGGSIIIDALFIRRGLGLLLFTSLENMNITTIYLILYFFAILIVIINTLKEVVFQIVLPEGWEVIE